MALAECPACKGDGDSWQWDGYEMVNKGPCTYCKGAGKVDEDKETIHLCDTCLHSFPECYPDQIAFGGGYGNDNVIVCSEYHSGEVQNQAHER